MIGFEERGTKLLLYGMLVILQGLKRRKELNYVQWNDKIVYFF